MKTIIFPVAALSLFFFACSSDVAKILNDDLLIGDGVNIPDDNGNDGITKDDGPLVNDDGQLINDDGQVINDDGQVINDDG
ncbi:MAG TPA: hypothetical protein PKH10_13835, partial [bacterium]|nr:hypothetical protein [bacterium]